MSIAVNELHESAYRSRGVAAPMPVTDGVWSIPVPLHGSPLRSIIVYLIETPEGPVVIDAGYEHPTCWDSFADSMRSLGHAPESVRAVLITHNHPDHVGFADRLREVSGAEIVIHHRDDFAVVHRERGGFLDQLHRALEGTGAPDDVVATMYAEALKVAHHAEDLAADTIVTERDRTLTFGDVDIRALHAPGHTYGHMVFVAKGAVFTGDTMMAEGPTQLAIPSLPGDNPAAELFATLDLIRDLGVGIACPAHQFAYRDVAARATALSAFHREEVRRVAELMDRHETAWRIVPHLDWGKPWEELGSGTRRFALVHTRSLLTYARSQASG